MILFLKQIFCRHVFITKLYSFKCYDEEIYVECIKCKKQLELGEF